MSGSGVSKNTTVSDVTAPCRRSVEAQFSACAPWGEDLRRIARSDTPARPSGIREIEHRRSRADAIECELAERPEQVRCDLTSVRDVELIKPRHVAGHDTRTAGSRGPLTTKAHLPFERFTNDAIAASPPKSSELILSREEVERVSWSRSRSVTCSPVVGLPGLEPGTFGPPDQRANQAAPQPVSRLAPRGAV
jgi:hypothetical protein